MWLMIFEKHEWYPEIRWDDSCSYEYMYHCSYCDCKQVIVPAKMAVSIRDKYQKDGWYLRSWAVAKGGEVNNEWREKIEDTLLYPV